MEKTKIAFMLLGLLSMSFASSCMFDTSFGRIMCYEKIVVPAKIITTLPAIVPTNITVAKVVNQTYTMVNATQTIQPKAAKPKTIEPVMGVYGKPSHNECSNPKLYDWDQYCVAMWTQGMAIDCDNANPQAKEQILKILASGKASFQNRCS